MVTDTQIERFKELMGEPDDADNQRWSDAAALRFINEGRSWLCEESRCFQINDTLDTEVGESEYDLSRDFIGFYALSFDGIPVDLVHPRDWRGTIGDDDTLQGDPTVAKYFTRILKLFRVPGTVAELAFDGWAYAAALEEGGSDTDLTDEQARAAIYRAVWKAKAADEREFSEEKEEALRLMVRATKDFKPKGPRYVRRRSPGRSWIGRVLNG
jgi:hypothetical protein